MNKTPTGATDKYWNLIIVTGVSLKYLTNWQQIVAFKLSVHGFWFEIATVYKQ